MAKHIEPTQTEFNSAEQVTMDVVSVASPSALTKTGSGIRELVVRPLAYMFSWMTANLAQSRKVSSIAYLKDSQATQNDIADAVASNYFVTRKQGSAAKGMITLTLNTPVVRLSQGASFTVNDVTLVVESQTIITNVDVDTPQRGVVYIKAIAFGDLFLANIPVVASIVGRTELPPGGEVTINFANNTIENAELTSAITGGAGVETDAELMLRAEYNTAESGIGTYNGLRKKFANAPISVQGLSVVAGEDLPLFRARYNNININPGGFVDVYVKTQLQSSVLSLDLEAHKVPGQDPAPTALFSVQVQDELCSGFFGISTVIADGEAVDNFTLSFGSLDTMNTSAGARLSVDQTATITFESDSLESVLPVRVYVSYIPGIALLQQFIDRDEERFVGQDVKVKAAVPVALSIDCVVSADDPLTVADIDLLKDTIANYINALPVGTRYVNFSDIRKSCARALPVADVRLPCTISAELLLQDGSSDNVYSTTGIFDLGPQANTGYWSSSMCFFSATLDKIRISQI